VFPYEFLTNKVELGLLTLLQKNLEVSTFLFRGRWMGGRERGGRGVKELERERQEGA